jgi:hypothetical protein
MGASSARHARDLLILVGRSAEPIESYDLAESASGVVVGALLGAALLNRPRVHTDRLRAPNAPQRASTFHGDRSARWVAISLRG